LAGESWQKIGFGYNRASRQAKDVEEFKTLRRFGTRAYERAAEYFKETGKNYRKKENYST